ncbi:hypothetical protein [Bernardetia sp.]|uniref:hypothetical protein n=1 Tax=Bernardetia sp. TaxID=1937974 RepID=UPI0025BE26BF|nr:hypothetical protein [Bernardetia sp.]
MEAELKIVGAIVIGVMFLANTGIGIWIYRIMKVADLFKEEFPTVKGKVDAIEKDIITIKNDIKNTEKSIAELKTDKVDKSKLEAVKSDISRLEADKVDKSKLEAADKEIKDLKSIIEKIENNFSLNIERFIKISEGYGKGITELNTGLGYISESLKEVKTDVKKINDHIFFEKSR